MRLDQEIFSKLAKKHNLHASLVRAICTHPFIFAKEIMASDNDHKDIRLAYLATFKLKKMFKDDKTKPYVATKIKAIRSGKEKQTNEV